MRPSSRHVPPHRSVALVSFASVALSMLLACNNGRQEAPGSAPRRVTGTASGVKASHPASAPARPRATSNHYVDDDFEFEASSTRVCPTEAPFLPEADHERLSVLVRIRSRSPRPIPVQALAFRIEGKQGEYSPTLAGCREALSVSTLSEGQNAQGEVAFDVPPQDGPFELVYEPFLLGRTPIVVRVKVPEPSGK